MQETFSTYHCQSEHNDYLIGYSNSFGLMLNGGGNARTTTA